MDSIHKKYYLVLEYAWPSMSFGQKSKAEIGQALYEEAARAKSFFRKMGNIVVTHKDENMFQLETLYKFLNPRSSKSETIEERISKVYLDTINANEIVLGRDASPEIDVRNYLAPRGYDDKYYDCVLMDGMYHSSFYVRDKGFPERVVGGWLDLITNYGENVNVSCSFKKEDRQRVMEDVQNRARLKRPALNEARRNRNDDKEERLADSINTNKFIAGRLKQREDFYYMTAIVTIIDKDYEALKKRKANIMKDLENVKDICVQDAFPRQEEALLMSFPINYTNKAIFEKCKRNMLTSSVAASYPFTSYELFDKDGVFLGLNPENSSLACPNFFDTNIFENGNVVLFGTSGAGKTYAEQTMSYSMRLSGMSVYYILPLKGYEHRRSCMAMGGAYIKLGPGSEHCINIMEIRPVKSADSRLIEGDAYIEDSLLTKKITQIRTFVQLLMQNEAMTTVERNMLDVYLNELYAGYGITYDDNDSIFEDAEKKILKKMPVIEDFYNLICDDEKMIRVSTCLQTFVTGSCKNMNGQTNVDFSNKYMVFDVDSSTIDKTLLPAFLFVAIDSCYDLIRQARTDKSVLFLDEVWKMMINEYAAEFVMEIFKIIRGYGSACVAATQDIDDFLSFMDGKYGKAIIRAAKTKIVLHLDENGVEAVRDSLKLNDAEIENILNFEKGKGLLIANKDRVPIYFRASAEESDLFTTDPNRLDVIKNRKSHKSKMVS